jgi:hypothetical protein
MAAAAAEIDFEFYVWDVNGDSDITVRTGVPLALLG